MQDLLESWLEPLSEARSAEFFRQMVRMIKFHHVAIKYDIEAT